MERGEKSEAHCSDREGVSPESSDVEEKKGNHGPGNVVRGYGVQEATEDAAIAALVVAKEDPRRDSVDLLVWHLAENSKTTFVGSCVVSWVERS